ncbi:MAG TPA: TonB-dependent receptor [Bryobacteraceae bacterium]|nr:TonB-dependent receptor [Bryobacteraceae bacterium]
MLRRAISILSLTLFSVIPIPLSGQSAARISGAVQDSAGAIMPGVKVTITDSDRGVTQTSVTNEAGRYAFPALGVGEYVVSAEAPGFKRAVTDRLRVEVNQSLEINIQMEVGQVTENVEVRGTAPLLQTSDSQVGGLVENRQMVDLPLAARDFMQLPLLSAGVVESRDNSRHQAERATWQGSFSVHGQSAKYNEYLFDGLSGKEVQHETNIFALSVDSIQEMRIQTSNYSAEFGGEAGGQINIVTKSGTNAIHGSVFEFVRNNKFDAREKFADKKPQLNRNTFGATVGGPIRRDKTFYFGSWESMRLRQGFTQNTTVPTTAFRTGDFSSLLGTDFSNPSPLVLYDWTTKQPFSNNMIPTNRLNPLTLKFMNEFVPLPTRSGRGGIRPIDNYQSLAPQQTRTDQFLARADHQLSSRSRLFARYIISDTDTTAPPVWPAFSYNHKFRGQHGVISWDRTLTPSTIFELRTGYSRFRQNEVTESAFHRDVAAELGLKGACSQPACWHAPYWNITEFSVFGNQPGKTRGSTTEGPRGWKNEIFQLATSLFVIHGNHTIKIGFTGYRHRDTFPNGLQPAGVESFNGQWTAGPGSSGYALADTLLGLPRNIQASIDIVDPNFRNSQIMPWAQDDWKITRKLTLNLGLRYEWMGKPVANRDKIGNFLQTGPATAVLITPQDTGSPLTQKRPDYLGRSLLKDDNNNLAPRVGLAYQWNDKTVIRGAYGIFYQRDTMDNWILLAFNPPFVRTGSVTLGVNETDFRNYPVNDLSPVVNFVTPGSKPAPFGQGVNWTEAYVQQWNLFVGRSLAQSLVFNIGYVGNKATGLPRSGFPNEPAPGPGSVQARRPFQNLSNVTLRNTDGQSSYHGLELQAEKRFAKGLSFIGAYTWSKTLDNRTLLDLWFGGNNKGLSALHIGHRFSYAGIWEIPYGKGKRFGSHMPAVLDGVLGGWQATGILVLRTGFPITVRTPGDVANTGGITQVPNRIRNANLPRSERTETRFFDTSAFIAPPAFTLGNAGIGSVMGPGYRNVDFSLAKVFRIGETRSLQFRGEFFNALNHPNPGDPGGTLGTATFGRITSTTGDPRDIQLGLKLIF